MNRSELEHVIRAAAAVVNDEIVVAGSQAVLGQFPEAPLALLRSMEVDVYPKHAPERAAEIDAAMGDGSLFHQTFDYYAHGIGPETIVAPAGWQERFVRLEVPAVRRRDGTAIGWSLEIHDLVLAKLAAGRTHDMDFVRDALAAKLVDLRRLGSAIDDMPADHRERVRNRLEGLVERSSNRRRSSAGPGSFIS